jgi:hypothetical protein
MKDYYPTSWLDSGPSPYTVFHYEEAIKDELRRQWRKLVDAVKAGKHPHSFIPFENMHGAGI